MYDKQPQTPDPIKLAASLALRGNEQRCLAAQCIRDLHDKSQALAAENAAHELSDAELIAWCKEYAVEKRKEAECADYDHWRNSYIREADTFDAIAARLAQPTDA